VFAYVPGDFAPMLRTLAWVDRQGRETAIDAPARDYTYPRVSPDGSRIAVTVFDGRQEDVWIWDLAGKRFTRLTSDPADDRYSEWTPNGRDIVFASQRGEKAGLWRQPADGGTADQLVATPTKPVMVFHRGSHPITRASSPRCCRLAEARICFSFSSASTSPRTAAAHTIRRT
jgi:dipeptidyl aminopeptidase/acylaminoacyl peptidase